MSALLDKTFEKWWFKSRPFFSKGGKKLSSLKKKSCKVWKKSSKWLFFNFAIIFFKLNISQYFFPESQKYRIVNYTIKSCINHKQLTLYLYVFIYCTGSHSFKSILCCSFHVFHDFHDIVVNFLRCFKPAAAFLLYLYSVNPILTSRWSFILTFGKW